MTEYKKGDKVVVEIDDIKHEIGKPLYTTKSTALSRMFLNDENILGKLEDFQSTEEEIKMTKDEKDEFDKLKQSQETLVDAITLIFTHAPDFPNLADRLYFHVSNSDDDKKQIEFSKAWEHPNRIKIIKKLKYVYPLGLFTSDGEEQYLTENRSYFASRWNTSLKQVFEEGEIDFTEFENIDLQNCMTLYTIETLTK